MNATIRRQLARRKRRIERRLAPTDLRGCDRPIMTASNIHYEIAERTRGIAHGGIGAIHTLARHIGLIDAIDANLHLLKFPLPYHCANWPRTLFGLQYLIAHSPITSAFLRNEKDWSISALSRVRVDSRRLVACM